MNKIDLSNLGGFPFEQDTLAFMQGAYLDGFKALASLAGDKVILAGVQVVGSQVSSGWISFGGELLKFEGGALAASVVVSETKKAVTFQDGEVREVYSTRIARCGVGGTISFDSLQRISALQNFWLPGDIKEKYCSNEYITANFDGDGYGLNREKGWRILSAAMPQAAGKVFVNRDPNDPAFDNMGMTGGAKERALTRNNLPNVALTATVKGVGGIDNNANGGGYGWGSDKQDRQFSIPLGGGDVPLNMMNPYFVILKLIKL